MRLILPYLILLSVPLSGQLVVRVNDGAPVTVAPAEFAKLPRHNAVLNDHGKQLSYSGPLLHDLIVLAGVDFGSGMRGKQISSYVTAIGSDGYQAVFAMAELDPTIVDSGIIVADKRDDQPLAAYESPMRIVAPLDKRAARSVRLLKEIDVVQLVKQPDRTIRPAITPNEASDEVLAKRKLRELAVSASEQPRLW